MGVCKPFGPFQSRTQAVVFMRAGGMTCEAVGKVLGVCSGTVSSMEQQFYNTPTVRTRQERDKRANRCVRIPVDIIETLTTHAAVRNITPNALIREVLDTIAESNLVDAILDDR